MKKQTRDAPIGAPLASAVFRKKPGGFELAAEIEFRRYVALSFDSRDCSRNVLLLFPSNQSTEIQGRCINVGAARQVVANDKERDQSPEEPLLVSTIHAPSLRVASVATLDRGAMPAPTSKEFENDICLSLGVPV